MRARLFLATLLVPMAAMAAVEVTPLVGYRSGELEIDTGIACVQSPCPTFAESENSPLYGAIVGVPLNDDYQFEVLVNRQTSDLIFSDSLQGRPNAAPAEDFDVTHLHVGLMRLWQLERLQPFVAAGVGQTFIDSSFRAIGGIDLQRWSGSVGGGVRFPLGDSDRFALRAEARGYWVDLPAGRQNNNFVALDERLTQLETTVGVTFKF